LVIEGAFNVEQGGDQLPLTTISSHCIENAEPCFVGEMAYFGNGVRTASVRCSGTTYVLELKPKHLEIILRRLPTFTQILCRQFTQRLKEANDILRELTAADSMQVEHVNFNSGEVIITQGSKADKLHLLIFGELEWLRDGELIDAAPIMDFIEPVAYFSDTAHFLTVRATGPTMTACTESADREAVIRNYRF